MALSMGNSAYDRYKWSVFFLVPKLLTLLFGAVRHSAEYIKFLAAFFNLEVGHHTCLCFFVYFFGVTGT